MTNEIKTTKVITGKCVLSYANVWVPKAASDGATPKYSASIIIPKTDKVTIQKIKNAIKTAEKWPSWKESSKDFYEAIKELNKKDSISRETLEYKSKFFFDIYVKYEEKDTSKTIKQQLGEKFRAKLPRIYRVYHWLVHLFRK